MNVFVNLSPDQEEALRQQIKELLISEIDNFSQLTYNSPCYMNKKQTSKLNEGIKNSFPIFPLNP